MEQMTPILYIPNIPFYLYLELRRYIKWLVFIR